MIPRGEVGLVFLGIGSSIGILSKPLEAAIIMMVILTTFIAPPLLRLVFPEPTTATAIQEMLLDNSSGKSLVIESPDSQDDK